MIGEGFKDKSDIFHDYLSLHHKAESEEQRILYFLNLSNYVNREKELKKLAKKIDKTGNFELIKTVYW